MRVFHLSILVYCLLSGSALAGDYYFDCASPNGTYNLKEGGKQYELFEGSKKLKFELLRKMTIEEQKGFCTSKDGKKFEWNSHRYLVDLKTRTNGATVKLSFLCEQGGSGVPAMISDCTTTTTSNKQLKPAYTFNKSAMNQLNTSKPDHSSTQWESQTGHGTATAIYAWSSGCKKDCNDEVDYQPIFSIDCSKKNQSADLTFWELGREGETDQKVGVWITIDGHTTNLKAKGASKLTGVSLDVTLPLSHPLFEEMAAGHTITYGSTSGTKGKQVSLKGSGKAVRQMLAACR